MRIEYRAKTNRTKQLLLFPPKLIRDKFINEQKKLSPNGNYNITVYVICLVAALGGLLFGLDQGFIANSLETIKIVYHLDTSGAEQYSAILATGGVVGALLSGVFARFLGRKKSLIFAGFIFSASSLLSALLPFT